MAKTAKPNTTKPAKAKPSSPGKASGASGADLANQRTNQRAATINQGAGLSDAPVARGVPLTDPPPPVSSADRGVGMPSAGLFSASAPTVNAPAMAEIGVAGLRESRGYIIEEFLPQLAGHRAIRVYRQMRDNDAIIGAIMFAITNMLRAVKWTAEPVDSSAEAADEAEFAKSLLDDMSHTFEDFISEALTMLEFGWAYFEIVLKNRVGPEETDPAQRSKYDDGRIGLRKLAPRAQDSLWRWEMDADGGIRGMWQVPPIPVPEKPGVIFLPVERSLLFRTTSRKNSPEGVSVLRNAYRSWWYANRIEEIEAIGIERELAGLPVVRIPSKYFRPDATAAEKAILANYQTISRDVKRNEQGGLVIPSDPWYGADGVPITGTHQVEIDLLTSGGTRAIDTDKTIQRHHTNIARSVLADFIMLGNSGRGGAYALSKNKTDLFLKACETFLNIIAAVLNQHMLPRLWDYNGLDRAMMPSLKPGRVAPVDLAELGAFLRDTSSAGAELFPDNDLENFVRDMADLPEKSQDAIDAQQAANEHDAAMQEATLAGANARVDQMTAQPPGGPPGAGGGGPPKKPPFGKRGASVTKYSPDQARDPHGMWTADGGGLGAVFASPNVQAHPDLNAAVQALSGARHAAMRGAMMTVDHEMGISGTTSDAVGAWRDGAENTVLSVVKGAAWDDLRASAAMKGWLANQKQVLVFQQGGNRSAYLASFHVPGDITKLHASLLNAGLENHTLSPSGSGATVWVYGDDQASLNKAADFAQANGARLNVRLGHGEFLGTSATAGADAWQRADARRQYEAAIGHATQRDGGRAGRAFDRIRTRYGQSLDAIKAAFVISRSAHAFEVMRDYELLKAFVLDVEKDGPADEARDEGGRWTQAADGSHRVEFPGGHASVAREDDPSTGKRQYRASYLYTASTGNAPSGWSIHGTPQAGKKWAETQLAGFWEPPKISKFDPSEARDDHGMWTDGGGSFDAVAGDLSKPISGDLNHAAHEMVGKLLPQGYDTAPNAPNTFNDLVKHFHDTGRMQVFDGASDKTIYADPKANYDFRAWHDSTHLRLMAPFTPEGEHAVFVGQANDLIKAYGDNPHTQRMISLLKAEIDGQVQYSQAHGGDFPVDQRGFDLAYLKNPDQAVHATYKALTAQPPDDRHLHWGRLRDTAAGLKHEDFVPSDLARAVAARLQQNVAKYSPDEARDAGGRWTAAGLDQLGKWLKHPSTKGALIRAAGTAAVIAGIEVPEHLAVHEAIHYALEHIDATGAVAGSAALVMVRHVMKSANLTAESAQEYLTHSVKHFMGEEARTLGLPDTRPISPLAGLPGQMLGFGKADADKMAFLQAVLDALNAVDPAQVDAMTGDDPITSGSADASSVDKIMKQAAAAAAAQGVPVYVVVDKVD